MRFTDPQYKRIADYLADIAKGLFLGAIATEAISGLPVSVNFIRTTSRFLMSLLFLLLSLSFTKEKDDR